MKSLFLLLLIAFQIQSALACQNRVDPSKAMIFIDTNYSSLEVDAAAKKACERGISFVRIPEVKADVAKRMTEIEIAKLPIEKQRDKACKTPSKECTRLKEKLLPMHEELIGLRNSTPKVYATELDKKIAELAGKNVAITTTIFSGHDGGGLVNGASGNLSKINFFNSMNKHYGNKPNLKKQLSHVLMWGCYTATTEEIMAWKATFPDLKILSGFNGVAPANHRKESANIMQDLLAKEETLLKQEKPANLLKMLKSIDDLKHTLSGIYVKNTCDEEYYFTKGFDGTSLRTLEEAKDCNSPKTQEKLAQFNEYFSGQKPHNDKELRQLYDYARKFDHCFDVAHPLDGNHVALLLFFKGVKYNFGPTFSALISNAQKEFSALAPFIPSDARSVYADVSKSFFFPTQENLMKKDRKEILENISKMESFLRHSSVRQNQNLLNRMKNLTQLQKKMEDYLHLLKSQCMNFLEWHNEIEGYRPYPKC